MACKVKTKTAKNSGKQKRFLKKDVKIFKEQLLNLRDEVEQQMRGLSENTLMKSQKELSGDISGYGIHMADVATDNYEREFNLGLVANERIALSLIDQALKRIKEGTYGICSMCGVLIKKTRLKAIPFAEFCKDCQETKDKGI